MDKIKKLFTALHVLLRHPRNSLSMIIDNEESAQKRAQIYVSKHYRMSEGFPEIDLLDLFPNFSETVFPYSYLSDTSMTIDIALLKAMARRYSPCSYLEIGTLRGESIANVAAVADDCTALSLSEEEMRACRFNERFVTIYKFFSKDIPHITHIGHDSQTYDFTELHKTFDLIFIDGDHRREAIKNDTAHAFRLLKNDASAIIWHDFGLTTERIRWATVAGILDGCPPEYRDNLYHVSNTKCALFIKGDFNSEFVVFPDIPDKIFTVHISGKKIST